MNKLEERIKTFEDIARKYIKRDGIENLLTTLRKTDFYTAPASTRYHDAEEGGLVEHSIRVAYKLSKELKGNNDNYSDETKAIVSLFHDICKVGYYDVEMRNKKIDGKWEQVPYYIVNDQYPFGHGEKSVDMLRDFIDLTEEEKVAIRFHMGAYEGQQIWNTLSKAYEKYPLALHLHIADMKATYMKDVTEVR